MMVSATSEGFQPLAVYARRARDPLKAKLSSGGMPPARNSLLLPIQPCIFRKFRILLGHAGYKPQRKAG